ncbi:hypothetical protein ACWGI8_13305 [Streptomyces sp. NPDC054841]
MPAAKDGRARVTPSQSSDGSRLGLSGKLQCQMLPGRATLTLDWADRILCLCGMWIVIGLELTDPREEP